MKKEKTEPWEILLLQHDKASHQLADFFEKISACKTVRRTIGIGLREKKEKIEEQFENAVKGLTGKILTIYGDGCYHHYTYGLCYAIARERSKNYIYTHIDYHTDTYDDLKSETLSCGAFVNNITGKPNAKELLFIGTDSIFGNAPEKPYTGKLMKQKDLFKPYVRNTIRGTLREKEQEDVYTSFDLDVMAESEILTDYNQGEIKLKKLLAIIEEIRSEKNIISADILGYKGSPQTGFNNTVSMLTYAALAAKIIGKDTKELEKLHCYFKKKRTQSVLELEKEQKEFETITEGLKI